MPAVASFPRVRMIVSGGLLLSSIIGVGKEVLRAFEVNLGGDRMALSCHLTRSSRMAQVLSGQRVLRGVVGRGPTVNGLARSLQLIVTWVGDGAVVTEELEGGHVTIVLLAFATLVK